MQRHCHGVDHQEEVKAVVAEAFVLRDLGILRVYVLRIIPIIIEFNAKTLAYVVIQWGFVNVLQGEICEWFMRT